jgi:hypothetical protein
MLVHPDRILQDRERVVAEATIAVMKEAEIEQVNKVQFTNL